MSEVDRPGDCDFLSGGGQMDTRMRAFDWTTTPLGPPERWPQNLKDAIASHVSAAGVNAPAREDERRRAEAPRAEEVLRESDARLRAVIEEAPLAIALTGRSGEILLRNPRFDQLWGRPAHVTTAPTYSDVYEGYQGKIELRRDFFTLGSIVSTAVEAASPAISAARHSLEIDVPEDPIWLYVDPARISQAITNLLNNSAKYTPQGGRIRLEAAADEASVTIRVIDNGIGLDGEALRTVFDMFRQANDRNGSQGGLGIGLTLARQLVEMHGGSVEAQSEGAGRGAEFAIRLPRAVATVPTKEQQALSAGNEHSGRVKVLVVDDNVDLVEMLSMVIEAAGHYVRKAFDGRSGISAALEYQPDLILLDVGMPDLKGTEVAKELRRHRELAGARIVALTGWGQPDDRQRTAAAGFDDHLTKPADPGQIQRILEEVAGRVRH